MATSKVWQRVFGVVIVVAALPYLAWLVAGDYTQFRETLASLSLLQSLGALCAAVTYLMLKALYHLLLCKRLSGRSGIAGEVLPAYCTGQLARYLPGKVWGVVYQTTRLSGTLLPREVVTANAIQMVTTNLLGASIIASALASFYFHTAWPLLGALVGTVLTETVHRYSWLERRLLVAIARITKKELPENDDIPPLPWLGTLILLGEWLAYFTIWLIVAHEELHLHAVLALGTWYAAASLLAIMAVAVPGGIAVREAIFIALSSSSRIDSGLLVAFAAVLRVVLTVGELACVPIALLIRHLLGGRKP